MQDKPAIKEERMALEQTLYDIDILKEFSRKSNQSISSFRQQFDFLNDGIFIFYFS